MSVSVSPFGPKPQYVASDGQPALGYKLFFYAAGSNTKQNTYTDSTGSTANANPLVLNSLGEPSTELWFTDGETYKVVFAPPTDTDPPTSPIWSIDNLRGQQISSTTVDQWLLYSQAPTYVSASSFSVPGNQTDTFQVARRVKTVNTGGTIVYGTITSSVYGAVTTVTITADSGSIDLGLTQVYYGILSTSSPSYPKSMSLNTLAVGTGGMTVDTNVLVVDATNNRVGVNVTSPSYELDAAGSLRVTTSGAETTDLVYFRDASNNVSARFAVAVTAGANVAATALFLNKNSSTSRSINAAGTVNASGADYAEYHYKAEGCGTVAKGEIVGIDSDGKITKQWASATRFAIKSTDPAYVGGDRWGTETAIGNILPTKPVLKLPDLSEDATESARAEAFAPFLQAHEAAMSAYTQDMEEFNKLVEAARAQVDRLAYAGQVPVNVTGAKPGDYIIAMQDGDGIKGVPVANPSFDQYRLAVLRVQSIQPDGRAFGAVIVH